MVELLHAHGLDKGTTLVRKDIKGALAVVVSNARRTSSAKRQVRDNKVNQRIVDNNTARAGVVQDVINRLLVLAEDIQRQGLITLVDILDTLDKTVNNHKGQDGSKDLALHQFVVLVNSQNQGRTDEQIVLVHLTTGNNRALGLVEKALETKEVRLVDDTAVRVGGLNRGAIELEDRGLEGFDQLVLDTALDNQVVGRNAGLTAVEELAKGQATGRNRDIDITRDERRANEEKGL